MSPSQGVPALRRLGGDLNAAGRRVEVALREVISRDRSAVHASLWVPSDQASRVGRAVIVLDRELRRAARVVESDWAGASSFAPIDIARGGIALRQGSPGSFFLEGEAYGLLLTFLLSNPVQTALTVQQLLQNAFAVRGWLLRDGGREELVLEVPAEEASRYRSLPASDEDLRVEFDYSGRVSSASLPRGSRVRIQYRDRETGVVTARIDLDGG